MAASVFCVPSTLSLRVSARSSSASAFFVPAIGLQPGCSRAQPPGVLQQAVAIGRRMPAGDANGVGSGPQCRR